MSAARIGVVGAGVMGAAHARTLAREVPGAGLLAVADVAPGRAEAVAEAGARALVDPYALIALDGLDGVVIASADETHEALVLACLAAGVPVLCEKPLATSAAGAQRIVEAEGTTGRRLVQVGFMRRYDPAYRRLHAALRAGELGAPLLLRCVHRNAASPPGFGARELIASSLPHEIDAARWLLGEELVEAAVHPTRAPDTLLVVLRTQSGVLVDVELRGNAGYGYDIRCEAIGDAGSAALPLDVAAGFRERFATAYRDELRAWVAGLGTGAPGGATAADGLAANAVADAVLESLERGRRVAVAPPP